jgi:hypothetical protein
MNNIYINQINFEFEETPSYHDILLNSGEGTQTLVEIVQTVSHVYVNQINIEIPASDVVPVSHIYVNQINIEVPVAEVPTDTLTCTQHGEQTIEEVITGTPVPEPEVAVGGGAGQRIRVMGGRPWSEEDVYVTNSADVVISEEILVGELIEAYANNIPTTDARIRKPIYAKPRRVEILSFTPKPERTIAVQMEEPRINHRQKEEEELILLGII